MSEIVIICSRCLDTSKKTEKKENRKKGKKNNNINISRNNIKVPTLILSAALEVFFSGLWAINVMVLETGSNLAPRNVTFNAGLESERF